MKIKILSFAILTTCIASANYNVIIKSDDISYDILKRWETVELSDWTDVDAPYGCTEYTPLASTIYMNVDFEQKNTCNQKQQQQETIYINYSNGNKEIKEQKINEKVISVENSRNTLGTFKAKSCNEILNSQGSIGSGTYSIYPDGSELPAYCDMVTDNGGWTLVGRSRPIMNQRDETCSAAGASYGNFGWTHSMGSLSNDNTAYSMGVLNKNLDFNQVLFGEYTSGKTFGNWAYKHNLSRSELLGINTGVKGKGYPSPVIGNNTGFGMASQIGAIDKQHFFFRDLSTYSPHGLMEDGWYSCYGNGTTNNLGTPATFGGNINYKPGMIFVR
jgi:hypothetical protein